jgi:hypothetical protein
MKRLSVVAILLTIIYSVMVIGAALHTHPGGAEHLNCKICQIFHQSALPESTTALSHQGTSSASLALHLPHVSITEIPTAHAGRAPPATSF